MRSLLLDERPAALAGRRMTIEEFERVPDAHHYELVGGLLVEQGMSANTGSITEDAQP